MHKISKDMAKVYRNTPTIELIRNRTRKSYELLKLKNVTGYWAQKERSRLEHMVKQLDAELAARAAQQPLF